MKVLLQGRIDLLQRFGGDSKIVLDIKKELAKRYITCDISGSENVDLTLRSYDLIHLFGLMRVSDLYATFKKARKLDIPIIVTPIYEDLRILDARGRKGFERFFSKIVTDINTKELFKGCWRALNDFNQLKHFFLLLKTSYRNLQKEIFYNANVILPSCKSEAQMLKRTFKIKNNSIRIIPYGIAKSRIASPSFFIEKFKTKNFVLSVGRIEPKKNQLSILKALKNTNIPILFVGKSNAYHRSYTNEFLHQIIYNPNAQYLGELDDKLVLSAYAAAKVHVLASWFEAPGIVSLEAALNNCNIVTTNKGYAKDYFGNLAWYCNPQSTMSIRNAVIRAFNFPLKPDLRDHICNNYTWQSIIPKIIKVYKDLT